MTEHLAHIVGSPAHIVNSPVTYVQVFMTDHHLAVVTEHAPGGPLFRHIVHQGRLPEAEARRYFRQLLAGISHCHAQVRNCAQTQQRPCMRIRHRRQCQKKRPTLLPLFDLGGCRALATGQVVDKRAWTTNRWRLSTCCSAAEAATALRARRQRSAGLGKLKHSLALVQGVYHRDLRLDALRLNACDALVLTDFGYSAAKLTASGEMADLRNPAASPTYTPPEVLLGHAIVNANYDGEVLGMCCSHVGFCAARPRVRRRVHQSGLPLPLAPPLHVEQELVS